MLKKILALTLALMTAATASAADIAVNCDVDYDTSIIRAECITEAKYNQAISVILYEGTDDSIDLTKIIEIKDINADSDGKASCEFVFGGSEPRGEYTISVSGGGYISNSGKAVFTYVPKEELADILAEINSAGESNIRSVMEKHSDMFALPQRDEVYRQLILIRTDDYSGVFKLIKDVKDSLKLADKLYELNNLTVSTDVLNYIKANASEFKIDTADQDFTADESNAAQIFTVLKGKNEVRGLTSMEKLWAEALAISTINRTDSEGMSAVISKYANAIGLDIAGYNSACTKYSAVEVNKAFINGNFKSKEDILAAYSKRLSSLAGSGSGGSSGSGSGSGGGSGSKVPSSGGMSVVNPPDEPEKITDFSDIQEAQWAAEKIKAMASKNIISGYEDKTFKPNKLVTREEFVTMLVRAFGIYDAAATCEFEDVNTADWYYTYVASVVSKRYASGTDEKLFGIGKNITRQDAAAMLYRAAKSSGSEFAGETAEFSDTDSIADYASEAVAALAGSGIINGFEDGSFRPSESLTRAQAAVMIGAILN